MLSLVCRFNNSGFCKKGENLCSFYHTEELCEIYSEKGICYRMFCRKRHHRACRFEVKGNCYRGNDCKFKHKNIKKKPLDDAMDEQIDDKDFNEIQS